MPELTYRPKTHIEQRIEERVQSATEKFTQPDQCWSPDAGNALDVQFVTVTKADWARGTNIAAPLGAAANVQFNLKKPRRCFAVVSIAQGNGSNHIFFSVNPTGIPVPPTGTFPAGWPFGNENWFSLSGSSLTTRRTPMIVLPRPITSFFLTMDIATGTQYQFTICACDDPELLAQLGYLNS
jgi:hypothetical protein